MPYICMSVNLVYNHKGDFFFPFSLPSIKVRYANFLVIFLDVTGMYGVLHWLSQFNVKVSF